MLIRRETFADTDAIAAVHRSAFVTPDGGEPAEATLVTQLRADPSWIPELSMVADVDGDVVGHVLLTHATVGNHRVAALGPIGVASDMQGAGIGAALMHAVLGAADALDVPLVGLLGHLEYYPRFGFVPAADVGITPPDPEWSSHFQVRTLARYDPAITGEFRYAAPFLQL